MFQELKKTSEPSAALLLLLLLSADFVFIILYVVLKTFAVGPSLCDTLGICAYMNSYHLIMLFWVIILFCYVLKSTDCSGYLSWILLFTYLLVDDAFLLHQKIGDRIADFSTIYLSRDVGFDLPPRFFELAVLAIAGFVLLGIVAWAYFHSPSTFKKISIDMLLFIAALVVFGLIVDVAEAIRLRPAIIIGLGFVEDGGELVVDSLIVWYVFLLAIRNGKTDFFLHDLLRNPRRSVAAGR